MATLDPQKLKVAVNYIDTWLDFNFHNARLPGLQVAIRHGNKLVYSKAFGQANIANKEPLSNRHVFRIASHSKTFTATAIMQLREAGKLELDDEVSKHLKWFKSSRDKRVEQVTIRQLLTHTAGLIRDGEDADYWLLQRDYPDVKELKAHISTCRLIYDQEKLFKYSNYGFGYLGQLIEAVTGQNYVAYVTKYIIQPLKLHKTGPELDNKSSKLLATGYGYELLRQPRQALPHANTKALAAATGFYANAEDATRYFAAHCMGNKVLLSDVSKRIMQRGYWKVLRDNERYGLGMVNYPKPGWKLYGHSGGFPGFKTNTKFDPNKQLVSSVFINALSGMPSTLNSSIISIMDTFQNAEKQDPKLDKYTGRFASLWSVTDIVAVGNKLYALNPMDWNHFNNPDEYDELSVISEANLRIEKANGYGSQGQVVKYTFDGNGKATSVSYAGMTMLPWEEAALGYNNSR